MPRTKTTTEGSQQMFQQQIWACGRFSGADADPPLNQLEEFGLTNGDTIAGNLIHHHNQQRARGTKEDELWKRDTINCSFTRSIGEGDWSGDIGDEATLLPTFGHVGGSLVAKLLPSDASRRSSMLPPAPGCKCSERVQRCSTMTRMTIVA